MKQLLILICLIGWMNSSFNLYAQTLPSETSNQTSDKFPGFTPPSFIGGNSPDSNYTLTELFDLLFKKDQAANELASSISSFQKQSIFQLIIDRNGKIMDCQLLQSSNMNKDHIVLKYLSKANLFITPPMLNEKPCNAVGIFKITYSTTGNGSPSYSVQTYEYDHDFYFYPIITDNTAER